MLKLSSYRQISVSSLQLDRPSVTTSGRAAHRELSAMVELSKEIITDSDASGTESSGSSVTSLPPKSSKKNTEKSESKSKKSSSSKKKARSPSPSSSSESGSESEDVAMSGQEDTLKRPSATM